MTTFYVYKAVKGRAPYPYNWTLDSKHDDLEAAEAAARKLCPNPNAVDTEPRQSENLPRAFFGAAGSKKWNAMIDTKDIHAER